MSNKVTGRLRCHLNMERPNGCSGQIKKGLWFDLPGFINQERTAAPLDYKPEAIEREGSGSEQLVSSNEDQGLKLVYHSGHDCNQDGD
jgi:hypothetical protein